MCDIGAKGEAVDRLEGDAGAEIKFGEVLFSGEGADFKAGAALKGAAVTGEVVEHFRGPKLLSYKYRRRKGYHRAVGHRQSLTRVKITSIG